MLAVNILDESGSNGAWRKKGTRTKVHESILLNETFNLHIKLVQMENCAYR